MSVILFVFEFFSEIDLFCFDLEYLLVLVCILSSYFHFIFTARQRSCGKVMFSQMYVCPQGVDISGPMFFPGMLGYLWYQLHSKGAGYVGGDPPTRRGIQWDTVGKRVVRILLKCFLL